MSLKPPLALLGLWFALFALLGKGKTFSPHVLGSLGAQRFGGVVAALILVIAILLGLRDSVAGPKRLPSAVVTVLAVFVYVGWTLFLFHCSAMPTTLMLIPTEPVSIERLADVAIEGRGVKRRSLAAELAFRYHGVRLPYTDEAGTRQIFQPSAEQLEKRREGKEMEDESEKAKAVLVRQAADFRWAGTAYLLVLGGALMIAPFTFFIPWKATRTA